MKKHYESLRQDSIISHKNNKKNKKNKKNMRGLQPVVVVIILIIEIILCHIISLRVKDEIIEKEKKRLSIELINTEKRAMDNMYDNLMNKFEYIDDLKEARLKNIKSLKDILSKATERQKGLLMHLDIARSNKAESVIINKDDIKKIENWSECHLFKLCYRGSRDGISASVFHRNCDGYQPTVTLIEAMTGEVFGGFTSASWQGDSLKYDKTSFLFSLFHNIAYHNVLDMPAINTSPDYLPCFGINDILLLPNNYSVSKVIKCYNVSGQDKHTEGRVDFSLKEIEVFRMKCYFS